MGGALGVDTCSSELASELIPAVTWQGEEAKERRERAEEGKEWSQLAGESASPDGFDSGW